MRPSELDGILNAHAFLRVERPPELWATTVELEPFIRLLGEMIAAALVQNGQVLEEITLNVSNIVIEPAAAGPAPNGDYMAVTIRSIGATQRPQEPASPDFESKPQACRLPRSRRRP